MANWYNTAYTFVGEANEIADLHNKLKELENKPEPLFENGFGKLFLGCVVNHFGGDWTQIECRGEIDCMELIGDTQLQLNTTTAWSDTPEVWDFVCSKYPSISHYYLAEEMGSSHFINSDTTGEYFPEKYLIDDQGYGMEYANSDEDLFSQMAERMEVEEIKSFEELEIYIALYNEDNPKEGLRYHKFLNPEL